MRAIEFTDRIRQNTGYALRGFARTPGFTIAVILTLGLGLGVNAAMFTFLDKVFVQPPAGVAKPAEVRRLYASIVRPDEPSGRLAIPSLLYPQIREIARNDPAVQIGVFTADHDSIAISVGAADIPVRQAFANAGYFRTLGVEPARGRLFDAGEDRVETPASVAMISHSLWQRAFNGDPRAIGSAVRIKDRVITIIGVTPEGFSGTDLDRAELWLPIGNYNTGPPGTVPWYDSYNSAFDVIARFTTPAAEARFLDAASRTVRPLKIASWGASTAEIRTGPLLSALGPAAKGKEVSISLRLGGVALIVLLIAVANVSNLLLVRATRREREIAIRRALGVSRGRLFEQLFTESLLLALMGGAAALALSLWAGAAIRRLLVPDVNWSGGAFDLRTAAFAIGVAIVAGLVMGLVPAIHTWRPDVISTLKSGGRSAGARRSPLRTALLVAQAALAVVLLVGAGLFVSSLRNVLNIDIGYDIDHTLVARASSDKRGLPQLMDAAMPAILERLSHIDGVESVAAVSNGPLEGYSMVSVFLPGRDSLPKIAGNANVDFIAVSPGYFRTVGQRVLAGRDFSPADAPSIVVGDQMAKAYWPGQSAVGQCMSLGERGSACVPVIGVVSDVHQGEVVNEKPSARYYVNSGAPRPSVVLRAPPEKHAAIARLVTAEIRRLVPQAEVVRVRSISARLEPELRPWRLGATLFTAMGVLALVVAAIGVYSVIAYAVSQRTNEMGIRVALGAQVMDIARLVAGEGLRVVGAGIVVGLALSVALGRLVASLLFGISASDPVVLGGAAFVLAAIGLVASVIPGLRAARVNPASALRAD
jgi:predicted permease